MEQGRQPFLERIFGGFKAGKPEPLPPSELDKPLADFDRKAGIKLDEQGYPMGKTAENEDDEEGEMRKAA